MRLSGSPPRAWGRLQCQRQRNQGTRFTPTCVGTTGLLAARRFRRTVHPHVRGDDLVSATATSQLDGSPPRAWGRRVLHGALARHQRFTPTCVGTTWPGPATRASRTVHPHVRGDDSTWSVRRASLVGSPPRAWGRHEAEQSKAPRSRFTPTCVGTTLGFRRLSHSFSVHPHVRGDDASTEARAPPYCGSPPRAWGRRGGIPTYNHPQTVHPHVRGDDWSLAQRFAFETGSPPRAWGRLTRLRLLRGEVRFTPTCVGTTSSATRGS